MNQPPSDVEQSSEIPMITTTLPEAVFILILSLGGTFLAAIGLLAFILYRRRKKARACHVHVKGAQEQAEEAPAPRTSDDERLPLTPVESTENIRRASYKARPDSTTIPSLVPSLTPPYPTPNPSLSNSSPRLLTRHGLSDPQTQHGERVSPDHDSWGWINEPRMEILDSYIAAATSSHENESVVSQVPSTRERESTQQPYRVPRSPMLPSTPIRDAPPVSAADILPQQPAPALQPPWTESTPSSPAMMTSDVERHTNGSGGGSRTRNKLQKKKSGMSLRSDTGLQQPGSSAGIQGALKRLTPSSAALMAMAGGVGDSLVSWWESSSEDERRKSKKKRRQKKPRGTV